MADRDLKIRVLLEAGATKLLKPLRDAGSAAKGTGRDIADLRTKLKGLETASADTKLFRQLGGEARQAGQDLRAGKLSVAELARAIDAADAPTKKMRTELERTRKEVGQLAAREQDLIGRMRDVRERMRDAGADTGKLASYERELSVAIAATNHQLDQQSGKLARNADRQERMRRAGSEFFRWQNRATGLAAGGYSAIGTGRAIGAPILDAKGDADEFESRMTDIAQKANLTRVQADALGKRLRIAGRDTNQMAADMANGVDALTGLGASLPDAERLVGPIAKAATAWKADMEDVSRASYAALDNLKVPAGDAAQVLNIMGQAGKDGAFEVRDMAAAFPELTASAQALGMTGTPAVARLAAVLEVARKGAGDSASAANNVQNLLSKITSPDAIKNFSKVGIDLPKALKKAAADGKDPIEQIIRLVQKATGGDNMKLGNFFQDMQVQQALRPLLAAADPIAKTKSGLEQYIEMRDRAFNAKGVLDADFAERMRDNAEQTKRMRIAGENLKLTLGAGLSPVITPLIQKATVLADRLGAWAQANPETARTIMMIVGGAALLMVMAGGLAIATAGLLAPFGAFSSVARLLGTTSLPLLGRMLLFPLSAMSMLGRGAVLLAQGIVRAGLMMLANPMVAAILALVAVVGFAGYMIWKHWDRIKGAFRAGVAFLAGLWGSMTQIGAQLMQGLVNGITNALGRVRDVITGAGGKIIGWFKAKLGIRSPSRVFHGLGGFLMAGLHDGIVATEAGPISRLGRISQRLQDAARGSGRLQLPLIADAAPVARVDRLSRAARRSIRAGQLDEAPAPEGIRPLARLGQLSRRVQGAIGAGAVAGSIAAAAPAAASKAMPARSGDAPRSYTIKVYGAPGQSEHEIARLVADQIRKIEAGKASRRSSRYEDDEDEDSPL